MESKCRIPIRYGKYRNQKVSVPLALLLALVPKCGACWAMYLSFLSAWGIVPSVLGNAILPFLMGLVVFHLSLLVYQSVKNHYYMPLWIDGIGIVLLVLNRQYMEESFLSFLAILLIFFGSFLSTREPLFMLGLIRKGKLYLKRT